MSRAPIRRTDLGQPGRAAPGPDLTDWALISGAIVFAIGGVLWIGGAGAALATGRGVPDGGILAALRALRTPADPAAAWPRPDQLPGPVPYWAATIVVVGVLAALATAVFSWRARRRWSGGRARGQVHSLEGLAKAGEVHAAAGTKALLRAARLSGRRRAEPIARSRSVTGSGRSAGGTCGAPWRTPHCSSDRPGWVKGCTS